MGPGPARGGDALLTAYARSLIRTKARQLCRRPGFSRSDEDDLAQDLTLSLLRKAHQYDPDPGASRDTFADRVVESEAGMILRARRRLKRAPGFRAAPLSGEPPRDARRAVNDPVAAADADEAVRHALAGLPAFHQTVADHLRRERSAAAVARELGVSRRRVNAAIALIRSRFEAAGLGPE